jgi:hypothetical protein
MMTDLYYPIWEYTCYLSEQLNRLYYYSLSIIVVNFKCSPSYVPAYLLERNRQGTDEPCAGSCFSPPLDPRDTLTQGSQGGSWNCPHYSPARASTKRTAFILQHSIWPCWAFRPILHPCLH